jgi:UDP-N-acetylglucosamine/UDP-N-acetylgalactosamine diphosphorylase
VRALFIGDDFPDALLNGLKSNIALAIKERIKRLKDYLEMLPDRSLTSRWDDLGNTLETIQTFEGEQRDRDTFLEKISTKIDQYGRNYITVIKNLGPDETDIGTAWLQSIVDRMLKDPTIE